MNILKITFDRSRGHEVLTILPERIPLHVAIRPPCDIYMMRDLDPLSDMRPRTMEERNRQLHGAIEDATRFFRESLRNSLREMGHFL